MNDRDTQVKVKICGMTNLKDVKVAVDGGVDAVGFIFYKKVRAQLPCRQLGKLF